MNWESIYSDDENVLDNYITNVITNALSGVSLKTDKSDQIRSQSCKKVHFGSPLVTDVREITFFEESFGQLDDTVPIDECQPQAKEPSSDQLVPVVPDGDTLKESDEEDHLSMSNKRSCIADYDTDLSKRIRLDSYEQFVDGLCKRSHAKISTAHAGHDTFHTAPALKKPRIDDLVHDDRNNLNEHLDFCSSPFSDEENGYIEPHLLDGLIFIYYHVTSYSLSIYQQLLLKEMKLDNTTCADENPAKRSLLFLKLFGQDSKPESFHPMECDEEEENLSPAIIECLANTSSPSRNKYNIATRSNHTKNASEDAVLPIGLALAREIITNNNMPQNDNATLHINNERCKKDFPGEVVNRVFTDKSENEKGLLSLDSDVCKCDEKRTCQLRHPDDGEIQSYLLPLGEEPSVSPDKSIKKHALTWEEIPSFACPKLPKEPRTELVTCSPAKAVQVSHVPDKTSFKPIHCNTVYDMDEELSFAFKEPTTNVTSVQKSPPGKKKEKEGKAGNSKKKIDEMISELMASQAVQTCRLFDEPEDLTPHRSFFYNFMKPVSSEHTDTRRQLAFQEMEDDSVVPDMDRLPGDETEENCVFRNESEKNDSKLKDQSSRSSVSSFSWRSSESNNEHLQDEDDSVVPFSHEPFIKPCTKSKTPQKLRLGLSKKQKFSSSLHPYKKLR